MTVVAGQLIALSGVPEASLDSRFGPVAQAPALFAHLAAEGCDKNLAFVIAHPAANFANHYLLRNLHNQGAACLAMNTRYTGNDTHLQMEFSIQDIGAGVRFLREQGFRHVVLIGNSGGGSQMALYQSQAERLTISSLPDGTPLKIDPASMPRADGMVLLCAHPGRAQVLTEWMDPSVVEEDDISSTDPSLDMYNPANGPVYDKEWLTRYRAAQVARNHAISDMAMARLAEFAIDDPKRLPISDMPLIVHRTGADPRFLDISLDPNERPAQNAAAARASNYAANSMGRSSTLRSWLSQWSLKYSRADGPECLKSIQAPVFIARYGADSIVFPSHTQQWIAAAGGRAVVEVLPGATHFMRGQDELQKRITRRVIEWARGTFV